MNSRKLDALASCALTAASALVLARPVNAAEPVAPTPPAITSVQEVIVTARKRKENLETTPVAITAIPAAQLQAAAAVKIGDLQGAAPNTLITNQATGAAAANIAIRGISFADVSKAFDPAVAVNIDGVYIGTSTGQLMDFFDIASIEILRGPQGTLFGRNSIGGVIDIHRSRPTGDYGGKFEVDYGSYNDLTVRGLLNLPIKKDILAAKLFYFDSETDGYYYNATLRHRDGSDSNQHFGTAFLFTPTAKFDALVTLEDQVEHGHPAFSQISPNASETAFCNFVPANECGRNETSDLYTVFNSKPNHQYYHAPAGTLEMNWDLGVTKLTSITSYRRSTEDQYEDFSGFSVPLYAGQQNQYYHQFSQELRASGNALPSLDYVAGLYYFQSRYHLVQQTYVFGAHSSQQDSVGESESVAAFADLNWKITDQLRLSGGGRITYDDKTNHLSLLDFPGPVVAVAMPTVSHSWTNFSPKVSLDYRPNSDLMLYASWSRGYRSGGFNGRGLTQYSATVPFGPETVDAYEIGSKSELFERRLVFNLALFRSEYHAIQESETVPVNFAPFNETIVANAASAIINGLEADFTLRPTRQLTLRGSVGLMDSQFHGFLTDGGTQDYSKVDLIYAPDETASLSGEYDIPTPYGDAKASLSYRFLAPYDQQIAPVDPVLVKGVEVFRRNDPVVRTKAQNLVDASLSTTFEVDKTKVRVGVYGRNLLNDLGTSSAFTVAGLWDFAYAREPRVFGVQLGVEF